MRFYKLFLCFFFILAGCDESRRDLVVSAEKDSLAATAIYFPDGMGVDFGISPIKDEVLETKVGEVVVFTRFVTYEFTDDYASVDKQLTDVLEKEGYSRALIPSTKKDRIMDVRYSKKNGGVMAYYKNILDGLNKKTVLVLYWRQ